MSALREQTQNRASERKKNDRLGLWHHAYRVIEAAAGTLQCKLGEGRIAVDTAGNRRDADSDERKSGAADPPTAETLAAVEHDFYDALAVIIARSQLLSRRLTRGTAEPADVAAGLAAIERAARRMVAGVGRLAGDVGSSPDLPVAERGGRSASERET